MDVTVQEGFAHLIFCLVTSLTVRLTWIHLYISIDSKVTGGASTDIGHLGRIGKAIARGIVVVGSRSLRNNCDGGRRRVVGQVTREIEARAVGEEKVR